MVAQSMIVPSDLTRMLGLDARGQGARVAVRSLTSLLWS